MSRKVKILLVYIYVLCPSPFILKMETTYSLTLTTQVNQDAHKPKLRPYISILS